MSKYISIGEAAKFLGVSTQTLRRWELEGRICPDERTKGGQRRYDISKLSPHLFMRTIMLLDKPTPMHEYQVMIKNLI